MEAAEIPKLLGMVRASSVRQLSDARMPIQDAIDLTQFLVDTTKGYFRFLPGADIVGGDTDVAVVTRHERFKWIKRKHFYPAHLNPVETDHDHGQETRS
jgi:ABC-type branched-subunit amino acid transport system substrate-binding protein